MAKFATSTATPIRKTVPSSPIQTATGVPTTVTQEKGAAFLRDAKSELFLTAVTSMVSEKTFYEDGKVRDQRFIDLIHQVANDGEWEWLASLTRYVRHDLHLRSAAVVLAAEYAKAWQDAVRGGKAVPTYVGREPIYPRTVVSYACERADEPAEILAYWRMRYSSTPGSMGPGREFEAAGPQRPRLPMGLKRGLADAVVSLYNQRSAQKYNGSSRSLRMADVIELVHPHPRDATQSQLFRYLLDDRHGHDKREGAFLDKYPLLHTIARRRELDALPVEERRRRLRVSGEVDLKAAGMTWEAVSNWQQGEFDAESWEALIPSMGYMALLRNLRNFVKAKVSDAVLDRIADRIADPNEVKRSRQLPIRFFNAWCATSGNTSMAGVKRSLYVGQDMRTPSVASRFSGPLERALDLSLSNVPYLPGNTVVMVDVSGSMAESLSAKSVAQRWEYAALFGIAVAKNCEKPRLFGFSNTETWVDLKETTAETIRQFGMLPNGGTHIWDTARKLNRQHNPDRFIIITDEQSADSPGGIDCPIIIFNVGGYKEATMPSDRNHFTVGGLSDAGFAMVKLILDGMASNWPWLAPEAVIATPEEEEAELISA